MKFCVLCFEFKRKRLLETVSNRVSTLQTTGKTYMNINGRDDVLFNFKTQTDLLNFLRAENTKWFLSQQINTEKVEVVEVEVV